MKRSLWSLAIATAVVVAAGPAASAAPPARAAQATLTLTVVHDSSCVLCTKRERGITINASGTYDGGSPLLEVYIGAGATTCASDYQSSAWVTPEGAGQYPSASPFSIKEVGGGPAFHLHAGSYVACGFLVVNGEPIGSDQVPFTVSITSKRHHHKRKRKHGR